MEEKEIADLLKEKFPSGIMETAAPFGDETIVIRRDELLRVAAFLKAKPQDFNMLLDLTCVDYRGEIPRFEMVYHFFSVPRNKRLRLKARLAESDLRIASLTSLWKNANWLEREVYDLFGVEFDGHPDLRRIFMYDEFEGHPLRKDYPLRKRQPRLRPRK